ncbi:hypothetical protein RFI_11129 [Reticulomyxa filosa]|uniref:Uncharacterized protein n=1 Tax=Reticulomyxa filosa TaxID=46433 RepID=X6NKV4_RETFI|nr:hypothetical protein RFI_11129 [Reticulomyxa filosa]|eukprot:ETO26007.1 hypothetical protein RFI_11129 [Reticulomyxa filosa]
MTFKISNKYYKYLYIPNKKDNCSNLTSKYDEVRTILFYVFHRKRFEKLFAILLFFKAFLKIFALLSSNSAFFQVAISNKRRDINKSVIFSETSSTAKTKGSKSWAMSNDGNNSMSSQKGLSYQQFAESYFALLLRIMKKVPFSRAKKTDTNVVFFVRQSNKQFFEIKKQQQQQNEQMPNCSHNIAEQKIFEGLEVPGLDSITKRVCYPNHEQTWNDQLPLTQPVCNTNTNELMKQVDELRRLNGVRYQDAIRAVQLQMLFDHFSVRYPVGFLVLLLCFICLQRCDQKGRRKKKKGGCVRKCRGSFS